MASSATNTRSFAFLYRFCGDWKLWDSPKLRLQALERELAEAPGSDGDGVMIEARRLTPAEVQRWRSEVPIVEAEFLGPVFGGIALTLHYEDREIWSWSPKLLSALAQTAWSCGGPVIRLADGAVRHGIDWVTFPAEVLCDNQPFGEGVLLRLYDGSYAQHVHECLEATFARAGARFDCSFYTGGREGSLRLSLCPYPRGAELPSLWRVLLGARFPPDCRVWMRGQEFRVIAYPPTLANERNFWLGS